MCGKILGFFLFAVGGLAFGSNGCGVVYSSLGERCGGANPAICSESNPCPGGTECVETEGAECAQVSFCRCEEAGWVCNADCQRPHACVPVGSAPSCGHEGQPPCAGSGGAGGGSGGSGGSGACAGPNPAACGPNEPCAEGSVCVVGDAAACAPSSCECAASGSWSCSKDCVRPAACVPAAPGAPQLGGASRVDFTCGPVDQGVPIVLIGLRDAACAAELSFPFLALSSLAWSYPDPVGSTVSLPDQDFGSMYYPGPSLADRVGVASGSITIQAQDGATGPATGTYDVILNDGTRLFGRFEAPPCFENADICG